MDSIGHYFGLTNQDYSNYVLRQLNGPNAAIIKAAIDSYLPVEIPHWKFGNDTLENDVDGAGKEEISSKKRYIQKSYLRQSA